MQEKGNFTIRVYGIIINENLEVLLSDEYMLDTFMIKFPGGGLEFGEGTVDCLKREAMEEMQQDINILQHYYTTDFYQKALYYKNHQLISIYYLASLTGNPVFKISKKRFDFEKETNGSQSFRYVSLKELPNEPLTFPIDKIVAQMLIRDIDHLKKIFGFG